MPFVTVLQPDPEVPIERFGVWLPTFGVQFRTVPLWHTPLPRLADVGDGILMLGGRMSAHHDSAWIAPIGDLLRQAVEGAVPVLAICLGHQILAEVFGGEVHVDDPLGGEEGPVDITFTPAARADTVLGPLARRVGPESVTLYESHHDAVVRLPDGAVPLAHSEKYPHQAFRLGSAVGVQFHPEASPELVATWKSADGGDPTAVLRRMREVDRAVAHSARLIAQGFAAQL